MSPMYTRSMVYKGQWDSVQYWNTLKNPKNFSTGDPYPDPYLKAREGTSCKATKLPNSLKTYTLDPRNATAHKQRCNLDKKFQFVNLLLSKKS